MQTQELATTLSKCAWSRSQLWVQTANIYTRKHDICLFVFLALQPIVVVFSQVGSVL